MLAKLLFPDICVACGCLLNRPTPNAKHDGAPLCTRCGIDHTALPQSERRVGRIEALYPYDGGLARALRRLKFSKQPAIAGPLGRVLATAPLLAKSMAGEPWDWVCNVPLHGTRLWSRGYDQAQLLARWACLHARRDRDLTPRIAPRMLVRRRATLPQSELGLAERLANLTGAFAVREPNKVRGRRVLVIDDVTTSGATLHACFSALLDAGAHEVAGLCLMRTLADGRALRRTGS